MISLDQVPWDMIRLKTKYMAYFARPDMMHLADWRGMARHFQLLKARREIAEGKELRELAFEQMGNELNEYHESLNKINYNHDTY